MSPGTFSVSFSYVSNAQHSAWHTMAAEQLFVE